MASSAHMATATSGAVTHNSRENFSHSVVFLDEVNECTATTKEAYKVYRQELQIRSKAYSKKTGQNLQANTTTKLSTIVNLHQHHTLKDLEPLTKWLEKELDTKVYQVAIHRDEGKLVNKETGEQLYSGKKFFKNPADDKLYHDKKYTQKIDMSKFDLVKNYHAHIECMGIDSQGTAIRRNKMHSYFLEKLQDKTAEVLQMERSLKRGFTQEQKETIKAQLKKPAEYASRKEYNREFTKVADELGFVKPKRVKRLDTEAFKVVGTAVQEAQQQNLATIADLKKEMLILRAQLQKSGAVRSDYAALEQLNKDLVSKVAAKDLTIEELKNTQELESKNSKIQNLKTAGNSYYADLVAIYETLPASAKKEVDANEKSIDQAKEVSKQAISALQATKPLQEENDTLKDDLKRLKEDMSVLSTSLIESRAEVQQLELTIEKKDKIINVHENNDTRLLQSLKIEPVKGLPAQQLVLEEYKKLQFRNKTLSDTVQASKEQLSSPKQLGDEPKSVTQSNFEKVRQMQENAKKMEELYKRGVEIEKEKGQGYKEGGR